MPLMSIVAMHRASHCLNMVFIHSEACLKSQPQLNGGTR